MIINKKKTKTKEGGAGLSEGLEARYLLANDANDCLGTHNGTPTSGVVFHGDMAEFNGTDSSIGINSLNNAREYFTISGWVNSPDASYIYQDKNVTIRMGSSSNRILWWDNKNGTGDYHAMDIESFPVDELVHFMVTSDHRVYINKEEVSYQIVVGSTSTSFNCCNIGKVKYNNGQSFFDGLISNLRVYIDEKDYDFCVALYEESCCSTCD